ncbi:uncharacterized protein F5Z01DRAFT_508496 [Emericellopsis atlantica]|uniref:Uncharacterized protein n=1 Tax=Emericellopsis atlantica TaxID=2614577 RepID=A0A9P8CR60_9HYPO|nr:uncharacterized protein F5Z01DRAFT_508496 [Emericellopsis atlantica]KAG9256393.1 hypothetical protein F5Z01DRAFT_508496 [Emericellopsis atlantica]
MSSFSYRRGTNRCQDSRFVRHAQPITVPPAEVWHSVLPHDQAAGPGHTGALMLREIRAKCPGARAQACGLPAPACAPYHWFQASSTSDWDMTGLSARSGALYGTVGLGPPARTVPTSAQCDSRSRRRKDTVSGSLQGLELESRDRRLQWNLNQVSGWPVCHSSPPRSVGPVGPSTHPRAAQCLESPSLRVCRALRSCHSQLQSLTCFGGGRSSLSIRSFLNPHHSLLGATGTPSQRTRDSRRRASIWIITTSLQNSWLSLDIFLSCSVCWWTDEFPRTRTTTTTTTTTTITAPH